VLTISNIFNQEYAQQSDGNIRLTIGEVTLPDSIDLTQDTLQGLSVQTMIKGDDDLYYAVDSA